jgi:glycosyltransferase involved in cell wall biosynthesis
MSRPDVLLTADLASVHVRRLARGLATAGLVVEIATFEGKPIDEIRVHQLGTRPSTDDRRYLLAIPRLARLIRSRKPRLVHAHYVSSFGLMTALSMHLAHPVGSRPGLIQTAWGTDLLVTARQSRLRRSMASVALRAADLITGDSADLQASAAALAPNVPFHRFVFGPDERLLTAQRQTEQIVLSTRRLDPDTRVDLIVRAFRMARSQDSVVLSGWRLVVAGSGAAADAVRAAAEDDPSVEFVGQLGVDSLGDLLLRSAVFVSIPRSDATSAALLEAMAAGVTPVVNDLPANREWVNADIGVLLTRDPDEQSLADAIVRAVTTRRDPEATRSPVRGVAFGHEVAGLIKQYESIRSS